VKKFAGILSIALLALTFAGTASAQYVPYMPNSNFTKFLSNHPNDAAELRANPSLMFNDGWQSRHPGFEEFMKNHPSDWHALNEQRGMMHGQGWFDNHNNWRDQSWWNQHHPDWVHQNYPGWASASEPPHGVGDYDNHHMWHDEAWWNEHHPNWVQHQINKAKHNHEQ
jgi:hypothetical protein